MFRRVISVLVCVSLFMTNGYNYIGARETGNSRMLELSQDMGQIVDSYQGKSGAPRISVIKDLHCNRSVQENIFRIIGVIRKTYDLDNITILVEGSTGKINTRVLEAIPEGRIKDDIIDYLLGQGYITGAEVYKSKDPGNVTLYGVEDKKIYDKDFKLLYQSLKYREFTDELTDKLTKILAYGKELLYPRELLDFEELERKYDSGSIGVREYLREITNVINERRKKKEKRRKEDGFPGLRPENDRMGYDLSSSELALGIQDKGEMDSQKPAVSENDRGENGFPALRAENDRGGQDEFVDYENISLMLRAYELEDGILPSHLKVEARAIMGELKGILSDEEMDRLEQKERVSDSVYYDYLADLLNKRGIRLNEGYQDFSMYMKVKDMLEREDDIILIEEIDKLTYEIKEEMLEGRGDGIDVLYCDKYLKLLEKYISNNALYKEVKDFESEEDEFIERMTDLNEKLDYRHYFKDNKKSLKKALKLMKKFYNTADKRNEIFGSEIFKFIDKDTDNLVIIVGGFHAYGVADILRARGIGYDIIMPQEEGKIDKQIYLDRLEDQARSGTVAGLEYKDIINANKKIELREIYLALRHVKDEKLRAEILKYLNRIENIFNREKTEEIRKRIEEVKDEKREDQYKKLLDVIGWRSLDQVRQEIYDKYQSNNIPYVMLNSLTESIAPSQELAGKEELGKKKEEEEEEEEEEDREEGAGQDLLITHQAPLRTQKYIEIAVNARDAILKKLGIDKAVGKFGEGFIQSLDIREGDEIFIDTKEKEMDYRLLIELKKMNNEIYVRDMKVLITDPNLKDEYGTEDIIRSRNIKEQKNDIVTDLRDTLKYNRDIKFNLTVVSSDGEVVQELINDIEGFKDIKGEPVRITYEDQGVDMRLTDNEFGVKDSGTGITDVRALLVPGYSTKGGALGHEDLVYKLREEGDERDVSVIAFPVGGSKVEKPIKVQSQNMPKELRIELPINTSMPESRNEIIVDDITVQGMKNIIERLFKSENQDIYGVANGLIEALRYLIKKAESQKLKEDLFDLKNSIKKEIREIMEKSEDKEFFPDMEAFRYIKATDESKERVYIDSEIYDPKVFLRGKQKIENFESDKYEAYLIEYEEDTPDSRKDMIVFDDIVLVDKLLYDRCMKNLDIAYLHTQLNPYIGYGRLPREIGRFVLEKKEEEEEEDTTDIEEIEGKLNIVKLKREIKNKIKPKLSDKNLEDFLKICEQEKVASDDILKYISLYKDLGDPNFFSWEMVKNFLTNIGLSRTTVLDGFVYAVRYKDKVLLKFNNAKYYEIKIPDEYLEGYNKLITLNHKIYIYDISKKALYELQGDKMVPYPYKVEQIGEKFYILKKDARGQTFISELSYDQDKKLSSEFKEIRVLREYNGNIYFIGKKDEEEDYYIYEIDKTGQRKISKGFKQLENFKIIEDRIYVVGQKEDHEGFSIYEVGTNIENRVSGDFFEIQDFVVVSRTIYFTGKTYEKLSFNFYKIYNDQQIELISELGGIKMEFIKTKDEVYFADTNSSGMFLEILYKDSTHEVGAFEPLSPIISTDEALYITTYIPPTQMYYFKIQGTRITELKKFEYHAQYNEDRNKSGKGYNIHLDRPGNRCVLFKDGKEFLEQKQKFMYDNTPNQLGIIKRREYIMFPKKKSIERVLKAENLLNSRNIASMNGYIAYLKERKKSLGLEYKRAIFLYGKMGINDDNFDTKCVQAGLEVLGPGIKKYIENGLLDNEKLAHLSTLYTSYSSFEVFWRLYQKLLPLLDEKDIDFERIFDRWYEICSSYKDNPEAIEVLLDNIESMYFIDPEDADDISRSITRLLTDERFILLDEKKEEDWTEKTHTLYAKNLAALKKVKDNKNIKNLEDLGANLGILTEDEYALFKKQMLGSVKKQLPRWFLEFLQNSADFADFIEVISPYYTVNDITGKLQRKVGIKDNAGMTFRDLITKLLVPGVSGKLYSAEDMVGMFGQVFFSIFNDPDTDEVEIKTGDGIGPSYVVRLIKVIDSNNQLVNIKMDISEYNYKYKGTEILQIKNYDKQEIFKMNIETIFLDDMINRFLAGLTCKYEKYEPGSSGEVEETDIKKRDKDIKIEYKNLKREERVILSEVEVEGLGTLRISRRKRKKGILFEHRGLEVRRDDKSMNYLGKVSSYITDFIPIDGLVVEFPDKVDLAASRNDVADTRVVGKRIERGIIEKIREGIAKGMDKAAVNKIIEQDIKPHGFPEDFYDMSHRDFYEVPEDIKKDAENMNKGNLDLIDYNKYIAGDDARDRARKLLVLVKGDLGFSLRDIAEAVRKENIEYYKDKINPGLYKRLEEAISKNRINKRKKEVIERARRLNTENPNLHIKGKEELDKYKPLKDLFDKIYLKNQGFGFKHIKFHKKDSTVVADYYPEYNEKTGELEWTIVFKDKPALTWIKNLQENGIQDLFYSSDPRKRKHLFFETYAHEYTHTVEYERGVKEILDMIDNLEGVDDRKIEKLKVLYNKHFCSLSARSKERYNTLYAVMDAMVFQEDIKKILRSIEGENNKKIVNKILAKGCRYGRDVLWTHDVDPKRDKSFSNTLKRVKNKLMYGFTAPDNNRAYKKILELKEIYGVADDIKIADVDYLLNFKRADDPGEWEELNKYLDSLIKPGIKDKSKIKGQVIANFETVRKEFQTVAHRDWIVGYRQRYGNDIVVRFATGMQMETFTSKKVEPYNLRALTAETKNTMITGCPVTYIPEIPEREPGFLSRIGGFVDSLMTPVISEVDSYLDSIVSQFLPKKTFEEILNIDAAGKIDEAA